VAVPAVGVVPVGGCQHLPQRSRSVPSPNDFGQQEISATIAAALPAVVARPLMQSQRSNYLPPYPVCWLENRRNSQRRLSTLPRVYALVEDMSLDPGNHRDAALRERSRRSAT